MAVGDARVFPGFLIPVLSKLLFPKLLFSYASAEVRERKGKKKKKTAGRKVHLNWGPNSQPQDHESDTLTTEPTGRDISLIFYVLHFQYGVRN